MFSSLQEIILRATIYDWLLLITGVLLILYVVGTWNYDYFARRGIPSTKPKLPFIGDSLPFFLRTESLPNLLIKLLDKGKGHAIYGFFELQRPIFMVRDPEIIKIITVKEFDHFTNRRNVGSGKADPILQKNVFNLEGQQWRDMRATLSPAFTTSKIKGMFPLISQCSEQMVEHLKNEFEEQGGTEKYLETDMKDLFTRMGNDVIASVAFGVQCDSLKQPENEFHKMGKQLTIFSLFRTIIFMGYFLSPKLMEFFRFRVLSPKAVSFFDSLVHETIQEREKKNIFRPDMLQLLMHAREGKLKAKVEDQHEYESSGSKNLEMTDEDVTAQAVIFFFAGFETVSTGLCFTSYQISHHPEVQKRLQQEVDKVWEKTGGKPSYEDVQGMKYLDAVINETLRLHPPNILVDRVCQEDTTIPPTETTPAVTIRKGQVVNIPIISIHLDPEHWPDPERFDPERFNDDNKHSIKPFSHIPFGAGPRLCIAQRLAQMELKIALAYLIRNFHIQPSAKTKHPLEYEKGFNINIKGGFWSRLSPRNV